MLGNAALVISAIYAIPEPANLGLALAATEALIGEIEALDRGAFYRNFFQFGVGKVKKNDDFTKCCGWSG